MYLDFELCDRNQNVLTRLDNRRPGGRVELGLNALRRGYCPLSLEDPARELASAVETVLRITLKADEFSLPLFIGRVVIPQRDSLPENELLGLNALDPLFQLERALARSEVGSTWEAVTFTGSDQSQIMWSLINSASTHGIAKGSLPASVNRDRSYLPGKVVADALREMSEVIGGPDFELEPTVADDGTLATFNTYHPRLGSDLSDEVVFVHGAAPYTASGFTYAPGGDGIVNRVLLVGAPLNNEGEEESPYVTFPSYVAEHAESIAKYGVFEQVVQLEDVVEGSTLKAHAEGIIAAGAEPIPYFDFTASPEQADDETGDGVPPVFGRDYWLGDTISCEAYLGGADEPLEVSGRITDAVVTELDSGQVAVKLSCSPEVTSTGITGEAVELKVPQVTE